MTPRPFYRSRLFWLGLPGLVFFGWLSLACHPRMIVVDRHDRTYRLAVGADDGLRLISMEIKGGFPSRVSFQAAPNLRPIRQGPPIRFTNGNSIPEFGIRRTDGVVAYSLLIPLYLTLWLVPVVAWQRSKSRLLKLHTAP